MPGMRPKEFPRGELSGHVQRFLDDFRMEGASLRSLSDYRSTLRRLCELYPDRSLSDFDGPAGTRLLQAFLRSFGEEASTGTLKKNAAILRSFFKWCEDYELLGRDPTRRLKTPRRQTQHRKAQPLPNVQRLIDAQPELCDRLAIMLGAMLALRRGAVRSIRLQDFDLGAGTVTVDWKGGGRRTMPFVYAEIRDSVEQLYTDGWKPSWYLLHVRRYSNLPGQQGAMSFPEKRLGNTTFQTWWRQRFVICGDVPYHDFHSLRVTAGTRLYLHTRDVKVTQNFLGHASARTTLDHYVRLDDLDLIAGMQKAAWTSEDDDD